MFKVEFEPARVARLDQLQVLRAFAAMLVVVSHVLRLEHEGWTSNPRMYGPALPFGDFGVYAFFVISGFIMYLTAGQTFGAPGAAGRFLSKRFSRIAPIYWLFTGLALICPFTFGWRPTSGAGVALSLAFLPDLTNAPGFGPALVVGWSLSFEMLFYLVFAACLVLPRQVGLRVLILAFPLYVAVAGLLNRTGLAAQPWWPIAQYWAQTQTLLFVVGVVLAMVHEQFGRLVDRRGIGTWLALALLALTPAALFAGHIEAPEKVEVAVAAAAVALCAMSSGPRGRLFKPFVHLGDASYALYLCHPFVIGLLSVAWRHVVGPRDPILFGAIALASSCATAWVVHLGLEKPLTRASRRILDAVGSSAGARQNAVT